MIDININTQEKKITISISGEERESSLCKVFSIIDNEDFRDFEVVLKTIPTWVVSDMPTTSISGWFFNYTSTVA